MNEDFSFEEDTVEDDSSNDFGEKKKIIKFLIIVAAAAIAGFSVYFITDWLINGRQKPVPVVQKDTDLELSDEMVVYLYNNVKYEVNGIRNDVFFNPSVTASSFSGEQMLYYAMRYATKSDFVNMNTSYEDDLEPTPSDGDLVADNDDENSKEGGATETPKQPTNVIPTYSISKSTIDRYLFNFFGDGVTGPTNGVFNIAFNFSAGGYNAGTMTYDANSDSYIIKFDSKSVVAADLAMNPYLYGIESAMREGKTNNIIIKEKVVFTKCQQLSEENGALIDSYNCGIFKDKATTNLIEQKNGVSKSQLGTLGIANYKENAAIITYTFVKDENDEYHFESSKIE